MAPLKGQKIKDNPKDTRIQIRLDKESLDKLDCLVTEQNSDKFSMKRETNKKSNRHTWKVDTITLNTNPKGIDNSILSVSFGMSRSF